MNRAVAHAELGLDHAVSDFDADAAAAKLQRLYAMHVSKVMHNGELWYIKGQEPNVMDAVKDMLLRGQVCSCVGERGPCTVAPSGLLCDKHESVGCPRAFVGVSLVA
jgi:hypothetical protein